MISRIIGGGVILLLVLSPLAYGCVQSWAYHTAEIVIAVLVGLRLLEINRKGGVYLPGGKTLFYLLAGLFISLVLIQLIPLPPAVSGIFKSRTSPVLLPDQISAGTRWTPLSLDPSAGRKELGQLLAGLGIFYLLFTTGATRGETLKFYSRLFFALTLAAFAISLFGIIQKYTWGGKIYWLHAIDPRAHPFGPYINRNHFAGYLEMVIPLSFTLFFSRLLRSKAYSGKRGIPAWMGRFNSEQLVFVFMISIMILALFISLSRAGIISFFLSMAVFALLGWRFHLFGKKKIAVFAGLLLLFFLLIFSYFGWQPLIKRIHPPGHRTPHRVHVWKDTLRMIKDYPLLGTGLGSFKAVYPYYKSFPVRYRYPYAENDYLQLFAETGGAGIILLVLLVFSFFHPIFHLNPPAVSGRRNSPPGKRGKFILSRRVLIAGGSAALIALFFHSFFDFNLHIPANFLLFSAIAGCTWRGMIDAKIQ